MINTAIFWDKHHLTEECRVNCSGEFEAVSVHVQGGGKDWELNLNTDEARQLIFDLHRAVMDALTEGYRL